MSWNKIETYDKIAYGASTFDKQLLDEWLEGKNITKWSSTRGQNVPRYLETGRDTRGYPNYIENEPPYLDHVVYFKATQPLKVWLVYQPYQLLDSAYDEIIRWAEQSGLYVEFYDSDKSWYSRGNTSIVVISY